MVRAIIFDCYGVITIGGNPWQKIRSNQPLLDFIRQQKKDYKIGMLSNATSSRLDEFLTRREIELFDAVVLSGEIGIAKPDTEAYLAVADRLGVAVSDCLFVDDSADYCEAAMSSGMQSIHYQNYHQFLEQITKYI